MYKFETYHLVWLAAHPYRTEEWLRERLKDSFDVHHIDGNHDNNVADNLILLDHGDHMWLHQSTRRLRRITTKGKTRKPKKQKELQAPPPVEPEPIEATEPFVVPDPLGVWVTCSNKWQVYIRKTDSADVAQAKIGEFASVT